MLGPFATAIRRTPIHQVSLLAHASYSYSAGGVRCPRQQRRQQRQRQRVTGDRYCPIEWAQLIVGHKHAHAHTQTQPTNGSTRPQIDDKTSVEAKQLSWSSCVSCRWAIYIVQFTRAVLDRVLLESFHTHAHSICALFHRTRWIHGVMAWRDNIAWTRMICATIFERRKVAKPQPQVAIAWCQSQNDATTRWHLFPIQYSRRLIVGIFAVPPKKYFSKTILLGMRLSGFTIQ